MKRELTWKIFYNKSLTSFSKIVRIKNQVENLNEYVVWKEARIVEKFSNL